MFGLFLVLCVVAFIVWRVKKSKSAGVYYSDVTSDPIEDDPKSSDWDTSTYTASTRTTYKPRISSYKSKSSSSSRSSGGFGGGRTGGGGSSSSF